MKPWKARTLFRDAIGRMEKNIFLVNPKRNYRTPFRLVPIRNNVTNMFSPRHASVCSVQFAPASACPQDKHDGAAEAVGSRLLLPYMH